MAITRLNYGSSFSNLVKSNSFLDGNSAYVPFSFESIATATGTGSSGTITFSSIPSTYKHLQIRGIGKDTFANSNQFSIYVRFNNDSGSNYASHRLVGDGTTASANGYATQAQIELRNFAIGNSATNILGASIMDVVDYASTSKYKTLKAFGGVEQNTTPSSVSLYSGLWQSTSAINRIDIIATGTAFTTSTTFALYGIKGA